MTAIEDLTRAPGMVVEIVDDLPRETEPKFEAQASGFAKRAEIERAVASVDGVETTDLAVLDDGAFKLTVWFADDTDTTAPLTAVLDAHELRLWDVTFEWGTITLVPMSAIEYPKLDGGEPQ